MRQTITQLPLAPDYLSHSRAQELAQIDEQLRAHPEWALWAHADLVRGIDANQGRDGMSGDRVIRVILLKEIFKLTYRDQAFHLADSTTFRQFMGLGWGEAAPKKSALQDNVAKVSPETIGKITQAFLRSKEALEHEQCEKVRVDCTVTKTNIHFPSDSSLLWDSIRVLTRLMSRAILCGVTFENRRKKAKKKHTKIYWMKGAKRNPVYREFLEIADQVAEDCADHQPVEEKEENRPEAKRNPGCKAAKRDADVVVDVEAGHRRVDVGLPSGWCSGVHLLYASELRRAHEGEGITLINERCDPGEQEQR